MSDKKQSTNHVPPPTIITLTLPTPSEGGIPLERATATLLIQRGELAHVRQFTYIVIDDMIAAFKEAYIALAAVEAEPPIIPEAPQVTTKPAPKGKGKQKAASEPAVEEEPTIDIPIQKGSLAVKISYLKIVGGETDAAAYRQAVLIAGKLVDGGLWDGKTPIRIDDVYTVQRKLKHLSEKELALFTLTDFVQLGTTDDMPQNNDQATLEDADNQELQPQIGNSDDEHLSEDTEQPHLI